MDSPLYVGDTTTSSIANQLYGTHINKTPHGSGYFSANRPQPSVSLAMFSGQKFIQLSLELAAGRNGVVSVLRRVQDSYVNVSQMLEILVVLKHYSGEQIASFFRNEITTNTQYLPESKVGLLPLFNDFTAHEVPQIRGLWISFDKAISIAVKFDIYGLVKPLFLVDVHDFDKLPALNTPASTGSSPPKRAYIGAGTDSYMDSPTKKRKNLPSQLDDLFIQAKLQASLKRLAAANANYPFTLPPVVYDEKNRDLIAEAKLLFHDIFKSDETDLFSKLALEARLAPIIEKCKAQGLLPSTVLDVSLDQQGKTALHYAATLACSTLALSLIELKICSPVRGDNKGESLLSATVQVTNAMVKGNFADMLQKWLWPGFWLFDNNNQSVFHHLISLALTNPKSSKFYLGKILEWVFGSPDKKQHLETLCSKIVNAQQTKSGNTALHLAGEKGLKWYVYLLLELNADLDLANNMGVKPTSFDCVNQVAEARKAFKNNSLSPATTAALLEALEADENDDEFLILLVHTGIEFWNKLLPFPEIGECEKDNALEVNSDKELTPTSEVFSSSILSNKIFKSIQDLLSNTNEEYEKVIHSKRAEINNLNKELRDATIVTANNRLVAKSISGKMLQVEATKLQMMNIHDKMQLLKKNLGNVEEEDVFNPEWEVDASKLEKYDADEPFIIKEIYDKLANGEDVEPTDDLIESLPPLDILKARLKAYEEVNNNLEEELAHLVNYGDLTAQFKKVVSSCTGVDINEVDELLDGLLEAVEGQQ
uniref:Transcriptional factor swi6 n=1 Tax=Metschnikowia australis TaxID=27321 RepID=A0A6C0M8R8_9ASCO|nr:transcriptional factor swi6 [Metschnikowia australis]